MTSGWNLWVWLECIGVFSGCCCKEVYRYLHNNYYFSLPHLYQLFFWQLFLNVFHLIIIIPLNTSCLNDGEEEDVRVHVVNVQVVVCLKIVYSKKVCLFQVW